MKEDNKVTGDEGGVGDKGEERRRWRRSCSEVRHRDGLPATSCW